jgi:hypothetical protein
MRLVRLQLRNFRACRTAEVEQSNTSAEITLWVKRRWQINTYLP